MADFEGLIRQALARQNDADPAIREKVYQSSRKALARMIASAGVQPPDVINRQRAALEESIRRIEAGYGSRVAPRRPASDPNPAPPRARPAAPQNLATGVPPGAERIVVPPREGGPELPRVQVSSPPHNPVRHEPAYVDSDGGEYYRDDDYQYEGDEPESTLFRRIIAILALVAILGVIGWLGFSLASSLLGSWQSSSSSTPAPSVETTREADPATQDEATDASYITILSPSDTTALETAGRGRAEIVSQSNLEMVRLVSLRPAGAREQPAPPILIRLQEGVLPRIAGNRVTVEILAKSGSTGPANFSVGCDIGGQDLCGRKRFRIGIQPEAIVFTINIGPDLARASSAYLAISTDISQDAELTGEGDPLDLLYARLRLPTE